jgi:hypothetical protein
MEASGYLHAPAALLSEERPRYPLDMRLGMPQSQNFIIFLSEYFIMQRRQWEDSETYTYTSSLSVRFAAVQFTLALKYHEPLWN